MSYNLFIIHDVNFGITSKAITLAILTPFFLMPILYLVYGNIYLSPSKVRLFIISSTSILMKSTKSIFGSFPHLLTTLAITHTRLAIYTLTPMVHNISAWPWSLFTLSLPYWLLSRVRYFSKPFPHSIVRSMVKRRGWVFGVIGVFSEIIILVARPFTLAGRMWVHAVLPGVMLSVMLKWIGSNISLKITKLSYLLESYAGLSYRDYWFWLYYLFSFAHYIVMSGLLLGYTLNELVMTRIQIVLFLILVVYYVEERSDVKVVNKLHGRVV